MLKRLRPARGRVQAHAQRIAIDDSLCHSCGACVAVCPPDALFLQDMHLRVDDAVCTRCDRCTGMCPVHALTMVSVDALEITAS